MIEFETNPSTGEVGWENQGTTTAPRPKIDSLKIIDKTETSIKVQVTTKRNVGGTLIYSIQEENGAYQEVERVTQTATGDPAQEEYTFNNLDSSKIYSKIKVEAIAENGETASKEINVIDIPALTRNDVILTANGKNIEEIDYTKGPIMVKIATKNVDTTGYKLQYATEDPKVESNWKEYKTTGVEFTSNGNLYVRLSDGRTGGKYATGSIIKIDDEGPTGLNLTVTDSGIDSITVTGSATDVGSGVARYYFSKDNGTTWEPENGTTNTSYTFTNLKSGSKCTIKMKAIDRAGNESTTTEPVEGTITDIKVEPHYTPSILTNDKVTVTITTDPSLPEGYTVEYSKDGTTWSSYTGANVMTENGKLRIQIKNAKGSIIKDNITANVVNIDKEPPKDLTITEKRATTSTITVEASTDDAEKTDTNAKSGMAGYRFGISKDGGQTWKEYPAEEDENGNDKYQEDGTYQFTDLIGDVGGVEYKIKVTAKDKVGNTTTKETTCKTIRNDAYYVEEQGSKEKPLATIGGRQYWKYKAGSAIAGIAYFNVTGSRTWTVPIVVSTDQESARIQNAYGNGVHGTISLSYHGVTFFVADAGSAMDGDLVSELEILNTRSNWYEGSWEECFREASKDLLDRYFFIGQKSIELIEQTTSSITVKVNAEASSPRIVGYRFSKDDGKTWTDYQESETYQFTDLIGNVDGVTYPIKVEVKDKEGNTKQEREYYATSKNDDYYVQDENSLLCTIGGREYKKMKSGGALCGIGYCIGSRKWASPVLVSTDPEATRFGSSNDSFGSESNYDPIDFHGVTFYVSRMGAAMPAESEIVTRFFDLNDKDSAPSMTDEEYKTVMGNSILNKYFYNE